MARRAGSDGARTEAAIREAAAALIARRGFEAVSMRRLAEAVGVQPGALYRYFPTKQDLLASMMRAHMRGLIEAWRAARPEGAAPAAELEAFARFHVRHHIARRDEVFINYMELRSLSAENASEIVGLRDEYEAELRRILARGRERGVFRIGDAAVASMALIAMLTGVSAWMKPEGRLGPRAIEDIHAALTLNAVGVRAEDQQSEDASCPLLD